MVLDISVRKCKRETRIEKRSRNKWWNLKEANIPMSHRIYANYIKKEEQEILGVSKDNSWSSKESWRLNEKI